MFTRTGRLAAAAAIAAIASFIPLRLSASQDDDSGRRGGAQGGQNGGTAASRYVVQLAELPVAAYDGRITGLAPTRPERGEKFDPQRADAAQYARYLDARHDQTLATVGGARKLYDYRFTFNGYAAELTDVQADLLRSSPGVLKVTKDELRFMDTSSTPHFLGLDGDDGLWERVGGVRDAGEGIVIGDIDSGIWPENPSFSNRDDDDHGRHHDFDDDDDHDFDRDGRSDFHGACVPGEQAGSTRRLAAMRG